MLSVRRALPLVAALLALVTPIAAQYEASARLFTRVDDGRVRAAIEIELAEGWHIYHEELGHPEAVGKPTTVELGGEGIRWGEVRFPEPERLGQGFPGEDGEEVWIWAHEGTVVLRVEGELEPGAKGDDVRAAIDALVCEQSCIPYAEEVESSGEGEDALFAEPAEAAANDDDFPTEDEHLGGQADGSLFVRIDGTRATAAIAIEIDEGWHLYHDRLGHPEAIGSPTEVELSGRGVRWGPVRFPAPHRLGQGFEDANGDEIWINSHEGELVLWADGELEGAPEDVVVVASIVGQTCDDTACVNYEEILVGQEEGSDALFEIVDQQRANAGTYGDEGEAEDGLLPFLLLAVFWGLFTLLMPCTYPMIPITISFFTKQADGRGGKVLPLSLAYGAGIVLVFILIGVVVGRAIIPFATHPATNLVIGALFLYFALVLFGVVNLQPPRFLMSAAGKASQRGGYLGVFLMGTTLVVTSFTCTAPFVGSLLSVGATDGNLGRIVLGMGVFGLTMAIPFVLLSLVPGRIRAMPRSGEWMNTLKFFLGFVEVAAALKFLSNSDLVWGWDVISRELFLGVWGVVFLAAGLFLFGVLQRGGPRPGTKRVASATLTLAFAAYCFWGMSGRSMDRVMNAIAPPYSGGLLFPSWHIREGEWAVVTDDHDQAVDVARGDGKLLLVNFTGFTCSNCRMMETTVMPSNSIAGVLRESFVESRLHTDGQENLDRILELQRDLTSSVAVPYYVVVDPESGAKLGRFEGASLTESDFLDFLEEGVKASRAPGSVPRAQ